jgi:septum formation protein
VYEPFECRTPGVDELRRERETALAMVTRLALAKARSVAVQSPDAWVIGSDQAAVLANGAKEPVVLGKPGTSARCIEQLREASGHTITFLTAVAVARGRDDSAFEFLDKTRVTFRVLDEATIGRYVARESPLDCAGGFKCEGLGISLCESIESLDPTALVGLPLIRLCGILRQVGYVVP